MRVARLLLATAGILVVAAPASAQIGFMGGWNYSMPSVKVNDQDVEISNKSGFNIGVFTDRGGLIGYMAGVFYSQKGFDSDTASVTLNYIEVPLMLRADIPFIRAYGGINVGFEIDCSTDQGPAPGGEPFPCENNTETLDFGFKIGAGVKLLMFSLDVAYIWGATDIWKSERGSLKNRVLQVDLGIKL